MKNICKHYLIGNPKISKHRAIYQSLNLSRDGNLKLLCACRLPWEISENILSVATLQATVSHGCRLKFLLRCRCARRRDVDDSSRLGRRHVIVINIIINVVVGMELQCVVIYTVINIRLPQRCDSSSAEGQEEGCLVWIKGQIKRFVLFQQIKEKKTSLSSFKDIAINDNISKVSHDRDNYTRL